MPITRDNATPPKLWHAMLQIIHRLLHTCDHSLILRMSRATHAEICRHLCNEDGRWALVLEQLKNARQTGKIGRHLNEIFLRLAGRTVSEWRRRKNRTQSTLAGLSKDEAELLPREMLLEILLAMSWDQAIESRAISTEVRQLIDQVVIPRIKTISVSTTRELEILKGFLFGSDDEDDDDDDGDVDFNMVELNAEKVSFRRIEYPNGVIIDQSWNTVALSTILSCRKTLDSVELQMGLDPDFSRPLRLLGVRKVTIRPWTNVTTQEVTYLVGNDALTELAMCLDVYAIDRDVVSLAPGENTWSLFPYSTEKPVLDINDEGSWQFLRFGGTLPSVKHLSVFSSIFMLQLTKNAQRDFERNPFAGADFEEQFPALTSLVFDGYELEENHNLRKTTIPEGLRVLTVPIADVVRKDIIVFLAEFKNPNLHRLCLYNSTFDVNVDQFNTDQVVALSGFYLGVNGLIEEMFVEPTNLFSKDMRKGLTDKNTDTSRAWGSIYYFGPLPMAAMKESESTFDFQAEFRSIAASTTISSGSPYRLPIKLSAVDQAEISKDLSWASLFSSFIFAPLITAVCLWDVDGYDNLFKDGAAAIASALKVVNLKGTIYLVNSQTILPKLVDAENAVDVVLLHAVYDEKPEWIDRIYIKETAASLYPVSREEIAAIPGVSCLPPGSTINGMRITDVSITC